jgi:hypothetical protein
MEDVAKAHGVATCNACFVVFGDDALSVAQAQKHAAQTALTELRTQNIVPCEKMAAGT